MFGEHHDNLAIEFPELKERIHELKGSDAHFTRLYDEYREIDHEVYRIEEGIETSADDYLEEQKKKRAALKDTLYKILKG